jgi:peptide/nickel transport system substrate-binding protein
MYGYATQLKSIVPDSAFGFDGSFFNYEHNLTKAQELLADAGFPAGFDCELVLGSGFADWENDAVIIQAELAKIGVNMDIKKVARAEFLSLMREGKAQMYISKLTPAINDVTYDAYMFFYSEGLAARDGYNNTRFNELVELAIAELDPETRVVYNTEMQELVTGDVGWVYLYQYPNVVALNSGVEGFTYCNSEMVLYTYLDK